MVQLCRKQESLLRISRHINGFKVNRGVRQGRRPILSLYVFNIPGKIMTETLDERLQHWRTTDK